MSKPLFGIGFSSVGHHWTGSGKTGIFTDFDPFLEFEKPKIYSPSQRDED